MGKKSLIKSTSKKKRAAKKSGFNGPTEEKNDDLRKPRQPNRNRQPSQNRPPKPAKKAAPKKTAPRTKPVSVKDLLKKKFDIVTPTVLYTVPAKRVTKSTFTAPERLAGFNAEDTRRIKGLLANVYSEMDLKAAAEKAAAEKGCC